MVEINNFAIMDGEHFEKYRYEMVKIINFPTMFGENSIGRKSVRNRHESMRYKHSTEGC